MLMGHILVSIFVAVLVCSHAGRQTITDEILQDDVAIIQEADKVQDESSKISKYDHHLEGFADEGWAADEEGPMAQMSPLNVKVRKPWPTPSPAKCFTARVKVRMPEGLQRGLKGSAEEMLMKDRTIYVDLRKKRLRHEEGPGDYTIDRYDLQCRLVHRDGRASVAGLPAGQGEGYDLLASGPLINFQGIQIVDGTETYKYDVNLRRRDRKWDSKLKKRDIKRKQTVWVGKDEPHLPVYSLFTSEAPGMPNAFYFHQYYYNTTIVENCKFDDGIFDAPECSE